jgi:hypothetical protein
MVTDLGNENGDRSINELLQWLPSEIINRMASIPTILYEDLVLTTGPIICSRLGEID